MIHGLVELLIYLAASFLVAPLDRALMIWLRFTALALVIKTMIHGREAHAQLLDTLGDRMAARTRHTAAPPQANPRPPATDTPVTVNAPATSAHARTLPAFFAISTRPCNGC